MTAHKPRGLGVKASDFWKKVTTKYDLRVDELVTLEAACRTLDLIETLQKDWTDDGKPTMTRGSQGQNVIDPRVSEMKMQRIAFEAFVKRLALPDADGVPVNQNRTAGQSRWASAHGSGA